MYTYTIRVGALLSGNLRLALAEADIEFVETKSALASVFRCEVTYSQYLALSEWVNHE